MSPGTTFRVAAAQEHLKNNRLAAAEAEVRAILAQDPGHPLAQTMLGVIHLKHGRLDQAEQILLGVHMADPKQIEPVGLLAVIRQSKNDPAGAAEMFEVLIASGQANVHSYTQLGACHLQLGDAVAAGAAFRRAVELDRNSGRGYYNLGLALKLGGKSYETYATFKRSIELNPDFLDGYVQLWNQMRLLLNWHEGLPTLEKGLRRHPASAQMMQILASTYGKVGQKDKAEALYQAAAKLNPTAQVAYAHWLQEEGRFDESVPLLQESIQRDPLLAQSYYSLSVAKSFDIDGDDLSERVTSLLKDNRIDQEGRMFLEYARAKALEHRRKDELAMQSYDAANQAAYALYNLNIHHDEKAVDAEQAVLRKLYPSETIEKLSEFGSPSHLPIFIVGMIRTGTTLLDQILSSHPRIHSAGEQPFWQICAGRVNRRWMEVGPSPSEFKELERNYLEVLSTASRTADRVVDKMPTNFSHVGLMSVVFPKARFIHLRRSPMDTCLSIYTTFLGSGTPFAYNQANILGYYRAYMRTMEHWRAVVPANQMIEVDYEDLVTNQEIVLREILSFCGLEWDDACLSHERHVSQVSTPSLWTARQPVNTASVERWRRFEPWLGELLELRDLVHPPVVR